MSIMSLSNTSQFKVVNVKHLYLTGARSERALSRAGAMLTAIVHCGQHVPLAHKRNEHANEAASADIWASWRSAAVRSHSAGILRGM